MKLKNKISGMIQDAIENFDFEEAIEEALDVRISLLAEYRVWAFIQRLVAVPGISVGHC